MLWSYSLQHFFSFCKPKRKKKSKYSDCLQKRGTSFLAGFCSLYDLAEAVVAVGRLVWALRREKSWWTNEADHLTAPVSLSYIRTQAYTRARTYTHTHAHPLSLLCNTEESWQNGRKHARSGQGRIWCQQPRTIKGVKVLPSLNCSRSAKWEPKLSTSFSEQNCLNLLCCNTPDRESFEQSHQGQ